MEKIVNWIIILVILVALIIIFSKYGGNLLSSLGQQANSTIDIAQESLPKQ